MSSRKLESESIIGPMFFFTKEPQSPGFAQLSLFFPENQNGWQQVFINSFLTPMKEHSSPRSSQKTVTGVLETNDCLHEERL